MSDFKFKIGDMVLGFKTISNANPISFKITDRIDFNGFMYYIESLSEEYDVYSRQWVQEHELVLNVKYYRDIKIKGLLR